MNNSNEFKDLHTVFSERMRPIVFWTGAGLSSPHIPSWGGLANKLIEVAKNRAGEFNKTDSASVISQIQNANGIKDLWTRIGKIKSILGNETFSTEIKRIIGASDTIDIPKIYEQLWSLSPTGMVTLNLDLFTHRASTSHPSGLTPISHYPKKFNTALNFLKERKPFIAYPHGYLDYSDSWAFTRQDLDDLLKNNEYKAWLNILFRSATVIFIGVTADDVAITTFMDAIKKESNCDFIGNFWITDRADSTTDKWANDNGIRVIRYSNTDGSHSELISMIKELKKLVKEDDKNKEEPVTYSGAVINYDELLATNTNEQDPDVLVTKDEEVIRLELNKIVAGIFKEKDIKNRDIKYQEFLNKYERSIHRSWYVSTSGSGKFLGYTVTREVAGGAFGTVYAAHDNDGNQFAIKVLKPENFKKVDFYRNFRRGVNSLRIITNRKINGVVEFNDASEIPPSLIMEWIDGPSLQSLVAAQQTNNWYIRLKIALELSSVLIDSHGVPERVYHRDLRPANIMVSDFYANPDDWKVIVLDFDLSWHKGAEDASIMHSPALGYLAPEQRRKVEGQNSRSALVDSYGFGMTLYYLCSGVHPYPDQHLLPSWNKTVIDACLKLSCKEWKSLPAVIARLILNSTLENQYGRWSMAQINGEIESVNNAINGTTGVSGETIAEELAIHINTMASYKWSDDDSSARYTGVNGLKICVRFDHAKNKIILEVSWEYTGDQDWSRVERMLSSGLDNLNTTLLSFGWEENCNRRSRGFTIEASINIDAISINIISAAKNIDKAVGYASSISSF
ncbi:protein kinase domain-containing protein [Deefgea piscis]|uniref:protein kinase domain-containing protein n=1 Tax=Deefgea piscis TaxID=2739061 RepID=UPI001C805FB6|nr:SIR2 family protein [Deefgea piscis]QZA82105.1 SIR2 family protein [Deefgea piscis]